MDPDCRGFLIEQRKITVFPEYCCIATVVLRINMYVITRKISLSRFKRKRFIASVLLLKLNTVNFTFNLWQSKFNKLEEFTWSRAL